MDAARRGHGSPPQNMELIRAVHYSYSRAIPRKLPLPLLLVVVLQSILS